MLELRNQLVQFRIIIAAETKKFKLSVKPTMEVFRNHQHVAKFLLTTYLFRFQKIKRLVSKYQNRRSNNQLNAELENNNLKIIQKSGREKVFEIHNMESNNLEKLVKIIKQNSRIENVGFSKN